jgi:ankyrin repeat protein
VLRVLVDEARDAATPLPNLNTLKDVNGATPLHVAAYMGNADVVRLLLLHTTSSAAALNDNREAPLHRAAEERFQGGGNRDVVDVLLAEQPRHKVALIDMRDRRQRTPLLTALESGATTAMIELLLRRGASVRNVYGADGNSALHVCLVRHCSLAAMRALLRAGADVDAPNQRTQQTPLQIAVVSVLDWFTEKEFDGANSTTTTTEQPENVASLVRLLLQHGASVPPIRYASAPLIAVVQEHQKERIRELLNSNEQANVVARTLKAIYAQPKESTYLHVDDPLTWTMEVEQRIDDNHSVVVATRNITYNRTPLQHAIAAGRDDMVQQLLDLGASLDHKAMELANRHLLLSRADRTEQRHIRLLKTLHCWRARKCPSKWEMQHQCDNSIVVQQLNYC